MKLIYLTGILLLATIVSAGQVKYIAHRGASYYAPENSLAAIRLAAELGADGAECDIQLTRDNQIVLWHDGNTERLTGQKLEISKTNWSDLKNLSIRLSATNSPCFKGQTMPLLKDVLKTITNGQMLVIEIKCGKEIFPELQKVIRKYWNGGNLVFISFGFETISMAKSLFPQIPCYYLTGSKDELLKRIPEIKKNNLDGVDLLSKIIDQQVVDELQKAKIEIWCWTVDAPVEANRMKELGVNVITTNRPTWLREQMAEKNMIVK